MQNDIDDLQRDGFFSCIGEFNFCIWRIRCFVALCNVCNIMSEMSTIDVAKTPHSFTNPLTYYERNMMYPILQTVSMHLAPI